ncbi:Transposase [Nostoc flagelliforme CCNUN1]|uniref:Transposase n=1 Tax=Nostoc flagelliforme CCNUN1 TaxID=2038116 RepID=A0A2K8T4V3_9NOSO|nr:Transposase [Nostoc flagelliforme CCNUN1]
MLEKCCLLLAANESFQDAENDLKILTGIEVGHSTHHRQVKKVDLSPPNVRQKLTEVCLDGGKVRLRSEKKGQPAYWKEYKTGRLQGVYYGAFFQDNLSVTNWINSQNIGKTLYCLGDGHDGIWNLLAEIADSNIRQEILDWYHLKENLYKIQAAKKFLTDIEAELWYGQAEQAISKLKNTKYVGVTQFTNYLRKHRHRLVDFLQKSGKGEGERGKGFVFSLSPLT